MLIISRPYPAPRSFVLICAGPKTMDSSYGMTLVARAGASVAIPPPTADQIALAKVVESIYGPSLIGILFAMILYGVSLTQMYFYFKLYKDDKWWTKYVLLALLVFDTAIVALDFEFLYKCLVSQFGFPESAAKAGWAFGINRGLTGCVGTIVQIFFAWRVQKLTGYTAATALISLLSFVGLGGSIALSVILAQVTFADFDAFKTCAIVWLIATATADITITVILIFYLRSRKSGINQSNQVIDRIIRMTMETGSLTTIFAIMDLVCYLTMGNVNGAHITFQVILSKLYINSLLTTLNSRQRTDLSSNPGATESPDGYPLSNRFEQTQVFVTVNHEIDNDIKSSYDNQDSKGNSVGV
ncbi:hypothetical protein D9758_012559 [Tetrapyrgos nigripes]|uniref:DUF6534 domain-containing protein n=1 Tax=Tetrapyrgos nigripes TaxID=182062 RepID=A0A8H5CIR0_9AGAR|nr:hypothetical protein D9758_012559 [Tetrapyrgos nigripes]